MSAHLQVLEVYTCTVLPVRKSSRVYRDFLSIPPSKTNGPENVQKVKASVTRIKWHCEKTHF